MASNVDGFSTDFLILIFGLVPGVSRSSRVDPLYARGLDSRGLLFNFDFSHIACDGYSAFDSRYGALRCTRAIGSTQKMGALDSSAVVLCVSDGRCDLLDALSVTAYLELVASNPKEIRSRQI